MIQSWYNINDGYSYQYAGFRGNYDIIKLERGNYIFKLRTTYKDDIKEHFIKDSYK